MPNFCVKCGAPLGGPFCVKCGADARSVVPSVQAPLPPSMAQPPSPHPASGTGSPASAKQGMSGLAKLGIAAVAIIFVGGAAGAVGVYYIAHRVSQKVHQAEDRLLGPNSSSNGGGSAPIDTPSGEPPSSASSGDNSMGDVCRFLSKEDVSHAVGVEIIRADSKDNGCSYIAKGDEADMLAKHSTAMVASRGGDKKTQDMIQTFAGGMFKGFQNERPQSEQDKSGEVLVFGFSVDQHAAEAQMRLNKKIFSRLGDTKDLPGIGDQAFISGDGMIMVRKGDRLIRIIYLTCPCGPEQVTPLAKKLADSL